MVVKQIRNAVQRELTYIQDQCSNVRTSAQTGSWPFTWKFSS